MVSSTEAKNLMLEIAELLQTATTEEKLQIKGILIGARLAADSEVNNKGFFQLYGG